MVAVLAASCSQDVLESAAEIQEQQSNGIEADINGLISKAAADVPDTSTFIAAATAYANFLGELSERDINAITDKQLSNIITIDTLEGFMGALMEGSMYMDFVNFNLNLSKFQGKYTASGDTWLYDKADNGLLFLFNHDFGSLPVESKPSSEECTIKLNMDTVNVKKSGYIKIPQVFYDTLFVGNDTLAWGSLDLRNGIIAKRAFGSLTMLFDNSTDENVVRVHNSDANNKGLFEISYDESEDFFNWVIGDNMQNGVQFGGTFYDMKEFISLLALNIDLVGGSTLSPANESRIQTFNSNNKINFSYYNDGSFQHGRIELVYTPAGSSNNETGEELGYNRINIKIYMEAGTTYVIDAPIESLALLTRDIIESAIEKAINEFVEGVQDFIDAVVDNFISAVGNVLGAIDDFIDARINDFISFRNMVINKIEIEVQRVTNACISIFMATVDYIDGFADIYKDYNKAMYEKIAEPWVEYFSGIISTIGNYQAQIIGHMAEPWIDLIKFLNKPK